MKKIIQNPIVDVILTFIIAYLLIYKTWILGDILVIDCPKILGIDLPSIMGDDLYYTWYMYINFIAIWVCGLIIISVFKRYRPILKAFSIKLKGNNIKSALIGGLSLGFGLNLIIALVAIATGAVSLHYVGMGIGSFVLLFIAVLIQSGAEELVARAFIYQRLRKDFPKWPVAAIVGNGLFFVMIHIGNPGMTFLSILALIVVSVMYSLVVYYFDSIWIPIVAHTTWNFTQSIVLGLPNSGIVFPVAMFKLDAGTNNFAFDSVFGIEGSVLAIILNIAVCIGIFGYGRKKGAKETNIWNA
ncbi:MAG: CPBP family intramembrane metalloprotease [Lachnospiraceae bacterium]|nr:CPBP family intramembrane metalloprotease [Candidatus Colinaster scatohippi]